MLLYIQEISGLGALGKGVATELMQQFFLLVKQVRYITNRTPAWQSIWLMRKKRNEKNLTAPNQPW
jgi:hypothetical protein